MYTTVVNGVTIHMTEYPTERDWCQVHRRALLTVGKTPKKPPSTKWRKDILMARHSPLRRLFFSFDLIGLPSYVSVHLVRHVHAQPYVRSQRNDRQNEYDRTKAPQDAPVNMIWDMTGEELVTIANKRLCNMADPFTQAIVRGCCDLVKQACPEFEGELVPMCVRNGGVCYEMNGGCKKGV